MSNKYNSKVAGVHVHADRTIVEFTDGVSVQLDLEGHVWGVGPHDEIVGMSGRGQGPATVPSAEVLIESMDFLTSRNAQKIIDAIGTVDDLRDRLTLCAGIGTQPWIPLKREKKFGTITT